MRSKCVKLMAMIGKRNSQSLKILLVVFLLMGAVALFPPCQTLSVLTAPREFLFFLSDNAQVNAGRLLAETLLILSCAGIGLVYVWSEDA